MILKIMSNPDNRQILGCIKNESKSIAQISKDTKLSLSLIYGKTHEFDTKQLLLVSCDISAPHRKSLKYKSKIRKVVAVFDEWDVDVKIYSNSTDENN